MQVDAIHEIVAILAAQHESWPRARGWAAGNATKEYATTFPFI
jgi:hypothetical protein